MEKFFAKYMPNWAAETLETIIFVAFVVLINFYVFPRFIVSGPSMCPTLNMIAQPDDTIDCNMDSGETVLLDKFTYDFVRPPRRGEILVFEAPDGEKVKKWGIIPMKKYYIKRVIGVGGDIVRVENGDVYRSTDGGETEILLNETYLSDKNRGRTQAREQNVFTVPEGQYLMFGDNRAQSLDARMCFSALSCNDQRSYSPYITADMISGRAIKVLWPLPYWRTLDAYDAVL